MAASTLHRPPYRSNFSYRCARDHFKQNQFLIREPPYMPTIPAIRTPFGIYGIYGAKKEQKAGYTLSVFSIYAIYAIYAKYFMRTRTRAGAPARENTSKRIFQRRPFGPVGPSFSLAGYEERSRMMIAYDHSAVPLATAPFGQELSEVWRQGRQWVVTSVQQRSQK